eukprot:4243859-Pyramimonas_sp.AAC.1
MPRAQPQLDFLLKRTRAYAHIAERTPGNIGGAFSCGRRADVLRRDTHAGQPASAVWDGDQQPREATTLLSQPGGQPMRSQDFSGLDARGHRQRRPLTKPLPSWARRGNLQ